MWSRPEGISSGNVVTAFVFVMNKDCSLTDSLASEKPYQTLARICELKLKDNNFFIDFFSGLSQEFDSSRKTGYFISKYKKHNFYQEDK